MSDIAFIRWRKTWRCHWHIGMTNPTTDLAISVTREREQARVTEKIKYWDLEKDIC